MKGETNMSGTIWALVPPIVAIAPGLMDQRSLFVTTHRNSVGSAALYKIPHPHRHPDHDRSHELENRRQRQHSALPGIPGNHRSLITKSGASQAYGDWASRKITSQRGALFSTMLLGVVIFVDDYFNCLTVGTVMRPVTDKIQSKPCKTCLHH